MSTYLTIALESGARYGAAPSALQPQQQPLSMIPRFRVHPGSCPQQRLSGLRYDGLRRYGRGVVPVACSVVRFRGNFFHHLRAHVSNLSSSSISRAAETPSLVLVGAPKDLSRTTLRPFGPGDFHCICQYVYAAQHFHTSVVTEFYVFGCHFSLSLNSYVQCRFADYASTIAERMSLSRHDQHFFIVDLFQISHRSHR